MTDARQSGISAQVKALAGRKREAMRFTNRPDERKQLEDEESLLLAVVADLHKLDRVQEWVQSTKTIDGQTDAVAGYRQARKRIKQLLKDKT